MPTFKNGNLEFSVDLLDLLRSLTEEEQLEVVEALSCTEEVIKYVSQQVFDVLTDSGYAGASGCGNTSSLTELDKLKRRIAEESSDVAKKEIERLTSSYNHLQERYDNLLKENQHLRYSNRDIFD